jgi:hypothetical protein
MKKILILIAVGLVLVMGSCRKYLSEPNRLQAAITTTAQLQSLIDEPGNINTWGDYTSTFYTDDIYIKPTAWTATPTVANITGLYYYTFSVDNMATNTIDYKWNYAWVNILNANLILDNVDKVTGSTDEKNAIKANAYFMRAYAYWNLVNHYCQPYHTSTLNSSGLPIRLTTSYTENLERASLQETYDLILTDIGKAQSLVGNTDLEANTRWRISKPGIDAFLSRYYLFTGDYNKSLVYSDLALLSSKASLVDFNSIPAATASSTYPYQGTSYTITYSALSQYTQAQFQQWPEFYYMAFNCSPFAGWYVSPSLVALYDQNNDLRFKNFLPSNSGFVSGWKEPGLISYRMFPGTVLPTGPTVAEILLNKAEASARLGDLTTAVTAVNTLRSKRYKNGSSFELTPTDTENALDLILQERRRELPFIFRFWDIRRFAYNETTSDDVIVTHTFYDVKFANVDQTVTKLYTLPVKSPRYAIPIPEVDIRASNGKITQNIY